MKKFEIFKGRSKTSIKGKNTKMKKPNRRKMSKIHFKAKLSIRPHWGKDNLIFRVKMCQISSICSHLPEKILILSTVPHHHKMASILILKEMQTQITKMKI